APGGPPDGIGILFDANWINSATKPRAVSARVVLTRAKPGAVRRRLQPIFNRDADAGIDVPPFVKPPRATESLVDTRWYPPVDACVFDVTVKTHRRGRFFAAWLADATGQPQAPLDGLPVPQSLGGPTPTLFGAPDYTDPGSQRFDSGLFIGTAESLRYGCWH